MPAPSDRQPAAPGAPVMYNTNYRQPVPTALGVQGGVNVPAQPPTAGYNGYTVNPGVDVQAGYGPPPPTETEYADRQNEALRQQTIAGYQRMMDPRFDPSAVAAKPAPSPVRIGTQY